MRRRERAGVLGRFDRGSVDGFRDYFRQLTQFEQRRSGWYGISHFTWLCINAKEAENVRLSREVIAMIPEFLHQPGVLGIGEIGLNKNTKNEAIVFLEHVDLAVRTGEQILIHTPHLEDKYPGTRMILDMLTDDSRLDRGRVYSSITSRSIRFRPVLEEGFWAGMTLYPVSKCTPERAADMVEMYGPERLLVNSAGDWGPSKPSAVPDFILEMQTRASRKPDPPRGAGEPADILRSKPWVQLHAARCGRGPVTAVYSLGIAADYNRRFVHDRRCLAAYAFYELSRDAMFPTRLIDELRAVVASMVAVQSRRSDRL